MYTVTETFIHKFKADDLVDVKHPHGRWEGPYKLVVYHIDPPKKEATAAAYMEIEIGKRTLKRWLIAGDQQIIRGHVPEAQKAPVRVRRVEQTTS